jgi:hypothetical protein
MDIPGKDKHLNPPNKTLSMITLAGSSLFYELPAQSKPAGEKRIVGIYQLSFAYLSPVT